MPDLRQMVNRALASRGSRRHTAQAMAAAAGSLLLLEAAANRVSPLAFAQDDDDNSGHGRGRGRGGDDHDNSGSGNAEDAADAAEEAAEEGGGVVEVPAGSLEVRIVGDDAGDFVPGELTVDVGQSVTFVNVHSDEHTATGSGFDTGIIPDEGGTATVVLDTPGSFPYACLIHPEMTGVIRVRDENGVVPETRSAAQEVPADATTVVIANLAFDPSAITVPTGTTVAWTNDDAVPHTVTSTDGAFDSGKFDPGGSFSFTFNEPGSFPYICQLHPQMQGTVTAEGEPVAGGTQAAQPAENATAASSAQAEDPAPAAASGASVSIVDFAFEPASLQVAAGETVVWTNDGLAPHTVTGDFADSRVLEPGQTFSHTFAESGEFSYVCAIHPQMTGTIRVSAGVETAATPIAAPVVARAGPEGVWLIHLTPQSDAILGAYRALVTFHDDGTLDADFSAEPGADGATAVLTSGQGEWLLESAECRISLIALMSDADQRFAGTATIDAQARLDADGRILDGAFGFAAVAAGGEPLGDGSGTLRGGLVSLDP